MKKLMLDTQIYDLIVTIHGLVERINCLTAEGKITLLCTHIQNDELTNIPDQRKRAEVSRIKRQQVTTAGAVYGTSKYGAATYGDGSLSGVSLHQIRSKSKKHIRDALIATTAARDADVLVTEDRRLAKRVRSTTASCQVWSFKDFKTYIFSL